MSRDVTTLTDTLEYQFTPCKMYPWDYLAVQMARKPVQKLPPRKRPGKGCSAPVLQRLKPL